MNDSASLNVNRGTGSSTEAEYISGFSISTTPFTVSAPGQNGNSGFLVLTYTIQAPTVSGTSADPSSIIYFGEWTFREWMPTGNTATSHYQNDGIDFATQSGVVQKTYVIPITLGSTLNVAVAEQLGIGWSANTTGATSASGFVDPFSSLTSVIVEDGNSNHISNFLVTDDQGDSFGANGLITPEPSSISLAVLGLLVLSVCAYRLSLRRVAIIETAGPPTPQ